jgi:mono/diheme cytochrome c family protein
MKRMIGVLAAMALSGCATSNEEPLWKTDSGSHKETSGHIKTISLTYDDSVFPAGEGRKQFITSCTVCHSLRYITMQPDFPKTTWVKTVDKMRKTYGAHITDEEANQIVEYLVSIKGNGK